MIQVVVPAPEQAEDVQIRLFRRTAEVLCALVGGISGGGVNSANFRDYSATKLRLHTDAIYNALDAAGIESAVDLSVAR